MKRCVVICCALAFGTVGLAYAKLPTPLEKNEAKPAPAKAKAAGEAKKEPDPLARAHDRAVANYKRNKREQGARAGAAKTRMAEETRKQAQALARAQQNARAASTASAAQAAGIEAKTLAKAQDRAVANYKLNKTRIAAALEREKTRAAAANARVAEVARTQAKALARAQDRAVANYQSRKGQPLRARAAGLVERLVCFTGSEDRHARIGVELRNGKVDYFAYYSKWKPRTCSIEVARDGVYSRWEDNGATSKVVLVDEKGSFLIDRKGGSFRFVFHDVDRGRYCGMSGKINGSLVVMRGKSKCVVEGVMDGHEG